MFKSLLVFKFFPANTDCGLLVLRLIAGLTLFFKHGSDKLLGFSQTAAHFPDPLHIGVIPSLLFATLADAICSLLLVLGLATRWAALIIFVNIFVGWSFVYHFAFAGGAGHVDIAQLIFLYLGAVLVLLLAGPGKYSLDAWLDR